MCIRDSVVPVDAVHVARSSAAGAREEPGATEASNEETGRTRPPDSHRREGRRVERPRMRPARATRGSTAPAQPCGGRAAYAQAMRINDEEFPTLTEFAERLELRELERLARMMVALFPADEHHADIDAIERDGGSSHSEQCSTR